jgi:anti-anti-sigma factor
MFEIKITPDKTIRLFGRFDASQKEKALQIFNTLEETFTVDFQNLDYISSAGLSVLLVTQKRLKEKGQHLKLIHLNNHIREIFGYAGFDMIFEIGD